MFEALGSRVCSRLIPAVCLRAALAQMALLCLILQVVFFHPNLVVAQEDISSRVPALIEDLKDPEWFVRAVAAEGLGRIGPAAKAAVPALIEALKDPEWYVRSGAARALGQIGPESKAVVPALIEALKDTEGYVRSGAAEALGRIGPEAKAAVPALIAALKDPESNVHSYAVQALGRIGPAAVPALIEALRTRREMSVLAPRGPRS